MAVQRAFGLGHQIDILYGISSRLQSPEYWATRYTELFHIFFFTDCQGLMYVHLVNFDLCKPIWSFCYSLSQCRETKLPIPDFKSVTMLIVDFMTVA